MNVFVMNCNSTSIKKQNNYNFNRRVSFNGSNILGKNIVKKADNTKLNGFEWGAIIGTLIAAPFIMIAGAITSIFSKMNIGAVLNKIHYDLYDSIRPDGMIRKNRKSFDEQKEKTINILNKYSKDDEYSAFVKEALEFLSNNFEKCDIFPNKEYNLYVFIRFIYSVAEDAISKNKKEVNPAAIEYAREAMRKVSNNNS